MHPPETPLRVAGANPRRLTLLLAHFRIDVLLALQSQLQLLELLLHG